MTCMRLAILVGFLAGVIACAAPLVQTGHLHDYGALQPVDAANRVVWHLQRQPELAPPNVLYIAPVSYAAPPVIRPSLEQEVSALLRERLYVHALRTLVPRLIITKTKNTDDYTEIGYTVDTLSVSITHVTRGNGLLRYVIGFGMGDTALQVEGVMSNAQTDEPLIELAVRIPHGGYPSMGINPRAISARHCLRLATDSASREIIQALAALWQLTEEETAK